MATKQTKETPAASAVETQVAPEVAPAVDTSAKAGIKVITTPRAQPTKFESKVIKTEESNGFTIKSY